jgi:hypothetical protein
MRILGDFTMENDVGRWSAPGIPPGYGSPILLYNPASETVIVQLHSVGSEFLPTRLFIRHKDDASYKPIGPPDDDVSFESAVTCDDQPLVAFNSMKWDKSGRAGNWSALYTFNIKTQEMRACASINKLVLPEHYLSGWISKVIHLSGNGQSVYVSAGLKRPDQAQVEHVLARLELANAILHPLSQLKDTFF